MRVVVSVESMAVARQFEQSSCLTVYTVTNGIITACQSFPNPGSPYESLAQSLHALGATILLVGSINADTAEAFRNAGIEIIEGVAGTARQAVDEYLTRTLFDAEGFRTDDTDSLDGE